MYGAQGSSFVLPLDAIVTPPVTRIAVAVAVAVAPVLATPVVAPVLAAPVLAPVLATVGVAVAVAVVVAVGAVLLGCVCDATAKGDESRGAGVIQHIQTST